MAESNDFSQVDRGPSRGTARKRAHLIPVLQEVQAIFGYLPEEALVLVSRGLDVSHEQGVRSGDVLLPVLPHDAEGDTYRAGMPGYGVPRTGR